MLPSFLSCRWISVVLITCISFPASAQPIPIEPGSWQREQEPFPATDIKYFDTSAGQISTVNWASLDEVEKKRLMPSGDAYIEVSKIDSSGKFSILPFSSSFEKGNYSLVFRWQKYRNDFCDYNDRSAGRVLVGVALEISANIISRKSGLKLSDFGALSAAADKGWVQGSIRIRQIGLGSTSPTLGSYLTNFELSEAGVTKALEAIAVTKAVLENDKNYLTPHLLAYQENREGSCRAWAREQLNKHQGS